MGVHHASSAVDRIPDDVLQHILRFVGPFDQLTAVVLVCSRLHRLLSRDGSILWEHMTADYLAAHGGPEGLVADYTVRSTRPFTAPTRCGCGRVNEVYALERLVPPDPRYPPPAQIPRLRLERLHIVRHDRRVEATPVPSAAAVGDPRGSSPRQESSYAHFLHSISYAMIRDRTSAMDDAEGSVLATPNGQRNSEWTASAADGSGNGARTSPRRSEPTAVAGLARGYRSLYFLAVKRVQDRHLEQTLADVGVDPDSSLDAVPHHRRPPLVSLFDSTDVPYFLSIFPAASGARRPGTQAEVRDQHDRFLLAHTLSWKAVYETNFRPVRGLAENPSARDFQDGTMPASNPLFAMNARSRASKRMDVYGPLLAGLFAGMPTLPVGFGTCFPIAASAAVVARWDEVMRSSSPGDGPPGASSAEALGPPAGRRFVSFSHRMDDYVCGSLAKAAQGWEQEEADYRAAGFWYARIASEHNSTLLAHGVAGGRAVHPLRGPAASRDQLVVSSTSSSRGRDSDSIEFVMEGTSSNERTPVLGSTTAAAPPRRETCHTDEAPFVPLLFPVRQMMHYFHVLLHTTFTQVDHHVWEPHEEKYAVCARVMGPCGDVVETRFFYSGLGDSYPRVYAKMSFKRSAMPGNSLRTQFRSVGNPAPAAAATASADSTQSCEAATTAQPTPDTSQQMGEMIDLFCGGYGRVEVDIAPVVSTCGMLLLRDSLGLPIDFPPSLLWNVIIHATGIGISELSKHMPLFLHYYQHSFTDAVEEAFGMRACYGVLRPTATAQPLEFLNSGGSTATTRGGSENALELDDAEVHRSLHSSTETSLSGSSSTARSMSSDERRATPDSLSVTDFSDILSS